MRGGMEKWGLGLMLPSQTGINNMIASWSIDHRISSLYTVALCPNIMAMVPNLPFGIHSVAPDLEGLCTMHRNNSDGSVPSHLRLLTASLEAMSIHVEHVGLEQRYFGYTVKDQGAELNRADNPEHQPFLWLTLSFKCSHCSYSQTCGCIFQVRMHVTHSVNTWYRRQSQRLSQETQNTRG